MHHVAVALQRQQLVDVNGAEAGDAADVVTGQVDEHHVLGALLGMLDELGGEATVVFVGAARACGCRRSARDHRPSSELHHRLRRRTDDGDLGPRTEYMYGLGFTWRGRGTRERVGVESRSNRCASTTWKMCGHSRMYSLAT